MDARNDVQTSHSAIRINAIDHVVDTIRWPKPPPLRRAHADIHVATAIDYALTDIVAQRFDAGVREVSQIGTDRIALRIGPDFRFAVVGLPARFKGRKPPKAPTDLVDHVCINARLPTYGGL